MVIAKKVRRKCWRQEAVATQAASAEVAAFIRWLVESGLCDAAGIVQRRATADGVRQTAADLRRVLWTRFNGGRL